MPLSRRPRVNFTQFCVTSTDSQIPALRSVANVRRGGGRGWADGVAGERGHSVSVVGVNGRVLARRAGIVALCVLSLVACVGLAWWQWQRFESSTGTWQNLGYVLQWPLFGLFPAFMFWRLRKLRTQHAAERPTPQAAPPPEPDKPVVRQDVVADDEDPELAAYNRYLAQLNARDQQETR
jgi:DNA-binding transcriptional regulator of glucitol operon